MFYSSAPPRAAGAVGLRCLLLLTSPLGVPSTVPPCSRVLAALLGLPQPGASLHLMDICDSHTSQMSLLPLLRHLFKRFSYPSPSTTRWN